MRDANKQNTIQTQTIHEVRAKQIGTQRTANHLLIGVRITENQLRACANDSKTTVTQPHIH